MANDYIQVACYLYKLCDMQFVRISPFNSITFHTSPIMSLEDIVLKKVREEYEYRPQDVCVTPFKMDERSEAEEMMSQFGTIKNWCWDNTGMMVCTYATYKEACNAIENTDGKEFHGHVVHCHRPTHEYRMPPKREFDRILKDVFLEYRDRLQWVPSRRSKHRNRS